MDGMSDSLRPYLDAAVEGDDRALEELIRRTQPAVWRMCEALGNGPDVDDLVQETYLRALQSLATFRGDAAVQTWFLSVARHVCADQVRRQQRQRRLLRRVMQREATNAAVPEVSSVDALLQDIDVDRREAFVLTQVLGLSYDEAADVLRCPVGTVRSRVSRARADLVALVQRSQAV
jgi:RNA polymerase sigma-70 factor, ECF subfamily